MVNWLFPIHKRSVVTRHRLLKFQLLGLSILCLGDNLVDFLDDRLFATEAPNNTERHLLFVASHPCFGLGVRVGVKPTKVFIAYFHQARPGNHPLQTGHIAGAVLNKAGPNVWIKRTIGTLIGQ